MDIQVFDFIRLTWCDTNGVARFKVVPRHSADSFLEASDIGMCRVTSWYDTTSVQAPFPKHLNVGDPDDYLVPQHETLHRCPWSGSDEYQVGQILCQLVNKSLTPAPNRIDTRYVCNRLLAELKTEFDLQLWSALEYEFVLSDKGRKPVFEGTPIYSATIFKPFENFFFLISKRLHSSEVFVDSMHPEYGSGQFEVTLKPKVGVLGPDAAFLLKQCVKESAIEKGMEASFICHPWSRVQNGGHFNFSVWRKNENVFTDKNDKLQLSKIAKNWIAGVFEHIDAITALICPTNNCFTRFFEGGFAPTNVCYDTEHRGSCIRVKHSPSSGTFMEFRSSGAAANPYIVTSAIVAAGLDGMRRDLQVSASGFDDSRKLPTCLKDALNALENDDVMKQSLGDEFIECYLALKRGRDLARVTHEEQIDAYWVHL